MQKCNVFRENFLVICKNTIAQIDALENNIDTEHNQSRLYKACVNDELQRIYTTALNQLTTLEEEIDKHHG